METVTRTIAMYVVLLVLFRTGGKRSLAETSPFDLILLLVISEAAQQALVGNDGSMTTAVLVMTTFLGMDIALSYLKQRWSTVEHVIDSVPLLIVADGVVLADRLRRERINADDILHQARHSHGLSRLDQIRYAILEPSGGISIIPVSSSDESMESKGELR